MKTKFKMICIALAIAFITVAAALFTLNGNRVLADDDKKGSSLYASTASIFSPSGEAQVIVDKQQVTVDNTATEKYYTMLSFGYNEDSVAYKKLLAYHWFSSSVEKDKTVAEKSEGYFNMEIGFKATSFKKFIITFESQQYTKTEAGKSVNYIIFFPIADEADGVKVAITDNKDATEKDAAVDKNGAVVVLHRDHINIEFAGYKNGEYDVNVSNAGNPLASGKIKNVGGSYAKYSTSSTTPVYPLIFNAQFAEGGSESTPVVRMVCYSLNNQKLEITNAIKSGTDSDEYYVNGSYFDDTPAVLCLNGDISHLNIGGQIKFDYQVIDVLRSSPSSTLYYYTLNYDDYQAGNINFNDYADKRFVEVKTDMLLDSDSDIYLPSAEESAGFGDGESFKVDMAVKAYAKVIDTSASGVENYVFLDWYLKDRHKLGIKGQDFIAVGSDKAGVAYNNGDKAEWKKICDEYQKQVDEAAKNLSAGSSSYIYLPSAHALFADNSTAYESMKISVYYYSDSQSQESSLATNNLSINVTKPGSYRFTLYATDAAGNKMYYLDGDKKVEFGTSDIWDMYSDDEKHDLLPWFAFNVDYTGAYFKKRPEMQSTAYVGTNYSSASFEINGVENSYEVKYRLFLFDRAGYYAATKNTYTYEEFIAKMDELFENNDTRKYFKEIHEVKESDENYEEFKDYEWSSSSTSFTPQDGNAFYYMRAEVTDKEYRNDPVACSLAVLASDQAKTLKGESEWLKNNLASVILLSVAGASFIAIILLLVIKPKDKDDIDVQFEKEVSKKAKK